MKPTKNPIENAEGELSGKFFPIFGLKFVRDLN